MQYAFLPVFLFLVCAIGLAIGLLIVSSLFNPGRPGRVTRMPYESGMDPIHDTRRRFDVRFHLLAIAFLIFDVELLFLYPWAVAMGGGEGREERGEGREAAVIHHSVFSIQHSSNPQSPIPNPFPVTRHAPPATRHLPLATRHAAFVGAITFLLLLAVGYVYDWRRGVFRWR